MKKLKLTPFAFADAVRVFANDACLKDLLQAGAATGGRPVITIDVCKAGHIVFDVTSEMKTEVEAEVDMLVKFHRTAVRDGREAWGYAFCLRDGIAFPKRWYYVVATIYDYIGRHPYTVGWVEREIDASAVGDEVAVEIERVIDVALEA